MAKAKDMLHLIADDKGDIASALRSEGYEMKNLFLKHNNPAYSISNNSDFTRSLDGTETMETSEVLFRELNILYQMHEIIPNNVPEIIADVKNRAGALCGYVIDYIQGDYFFSESYSKNSNSLNQLECAVIALHQNKIAHGDLHKRNILVKSDGKIVLIDPYAFSEDDPTKLFVVHSASDRMWLERYEEEIQLRFIAEQRV